MAALARIFLPVTKRNGTGPLIFLDKHEFLKWGGTGEVDQQLRAPAALPEEAN